MRAIKSVLLSLLFTTVGAMGSVLPPGPGPGPLQLPSSPERESPHERVVIYEITLSRLSDNENTPPTKMQRVTLAAKMNSTAYVKSATQIPYACPDEKDGRVSSCLVEEGASFSITPRPAGSVTPRVLAEVDLAVTDVLGLKEVLTSGGQPPTLRKRLLQMVQDVALGEGETVHIIDGGYALDVELTSIR